MFTSKSWLLVQAGSVCMMQKSIFPRVNPPLSGTEQQVCFHFSLILHHCCSLVFGCRLREYFPRRPGSVSIRCFAKLSKVVVVFGGLCRRVCGRKRKGTPVKVCDRAYVTEDEEEESMSEHSYSPGKYGPAPIFSPAVYFQIPREMALILENVR